MPYVELLHSDPVAAREAAPELASGIADALGLPHDAVIVAVVTLDAVTDGTGEVGSWPAAILHGRPRESERMERACERATELLSARLQVAPERVFVQWSAPPALRR